MKLALKAVAGPLKDDIFPLTDGLTLGRSGELVLNDQKVSSIHARIRESGGHWVIEDNNSKNGIWVENNRVSSLPLAHGVTFSIGDNVFEVILLGAPKPLKKQRYWYDVLADFTTEQALDIKDKTKPLAPLSPALVLDFTRGVQMDSRWVLGFGPRKIGSQHVDLPIWEPGAPATCFEILPSPDGILFKTKHAGTVLLNGEKVDSRVLRVGDTIRIRDTVIEVDFSE